MPYVTKTKSVTKTRTLGYDPIPIHRPKFIYFEFTGLRPEAPHWMFFGDIEITKFVNTSYTKANYNAAGRTSTLKNPGERFVNATEFPSGGRLTYGGATAQGGESDPLYSDANGILKGVFYLQSNTTYSWSINTDGHQLLATDAYSTDTTNALSVGTALFKGFGQYENYWQWTTTQSYQVWVNPPPVYNDGGSNADNGQPSPAIATTSNSSGSKGSKSYGTPTYGDYSGGGSGSYGVSHGVSATSSATSGSGMSNTGDWGCFVANTPIDMADGTQKAIADLRLGEYTKGGIVQGIHIYGGAPLYEYNGVRVSGTHYVIENNRAIMVQDTSTAIKVPDVYGLYTIDTSDRRIFSNGIEFADHNGDKVIIDFFNNMKTDMHHGALVQEIEKQITAAQL